MLSRFKLKAADLFVVDTSLTLTFKSSTKSETNCYSKTWQRLNKRLLKNDHIGYYLYLLFLTIIPLFLSTGIFTSLYSRLTKFYVANSTRQYNVWTNCFERTTITYSCHANWSNEIKLKYLSKLDSTWRFFIATPSLGCFDRVLDEIRI